MGNKGGKDKQAGGKKPSGGKQPPAPTPSVYDTRPALPKQPENSFAELDNIRIEGFSRDEIKRIFDQFMANNPDGKLDKREFIAFYSKIRAEPVERLDEICDFVFRAFDSDNNGYLTFSEFMVRLSY